MKRTAPATETHEEQKATRRRQEPVSCQVCRKKKLKCSRTFPCSNCVSRGLDCQPPDVTHWSPGQERSSSVAATNPDTSVLARVLERLQRLEDIVLKTGEGNSLNGLTKDKADGGGAISSSTTHEDVAQNEIFHSVARSDASPLFNIRTEDEFRDTEITGSRPSKAADDEASFLFASHGVSEIIFDLNLKAPVLTKITVIGSRVVRRICLPAREEAHILFKSYASSIGSWYHIYHRQTVEALLDKVYHQIACGQRPITAHVALLLSMFAGGAYFQAFAAWPETVFSGSQEANQLALVWANNTLDILDHVERVPIPTSVEQLQATISMSLMIQNLEGLSKKYWLLHTSSITLARDLSIHVLDHPAREKSKDLIENEVKRRIWWFLATTDW